MMQADAARKRLYIRLHDIYHKGDPLAGDSGRGSALMCARVIKLRLTTCYDASRRIYNRCLTDDVSS